MKKLVLPAMALAAFALGTLAHVGNAEARRVAARSQRWRVQALGEWVLIWMIYQVSLGTTIVAPAPIYFHDQAACEAVAGKLGAVGDEQFTVRGRCYATRTRQEPPN